MAMQWRCLVQIKKTAAQQMLIGKINTSIQNTSRSSLLYLML